MNAKASGSNHDSRTPSQPSPLARGRDRVGVMIHTFAIAALAAMAGCGVDTATTAATGAAIKKQEVEQGKKTLEQMQQKLEQANQQVQQRSEQGGGNH